jgi:serine/threonine protein kinase
MKRCPSCQSVFPANYTHCPRDGSSLTEASDWSEGTVVRGKYQIIGKVGQGGMAAVYKALHVRFKEPRALKVINPELANDANFVRRFEQEAIIARKLQHPNAVRVDDIDEAEDGRPFIVMEFIEGGNLRDVIEQEAPLLVARVCSIVKQIAAALDAAHRLGLVHRDIKPANIALVRPGDGLQPSGDWVKVLDFGIAKLKEAHLEDSKVHPMSLMTMTGTGMVIGTPVYMSPEQAKGLKGEQLDGRSDIYSLGVVAYQMLTGDLPLKADSTLELLMAHVNTPPRPIHEVRPDTRIPAAVAAVVMRCLEKNRALRPANGQALIEEIELAAGRGPALPVKPSEAVNREPIARTRTADLLALPTANQKNGAQRLRAWLWVATTVLIAVVFGGIWYLRDMNHPARGGPAVASTSTETHQTEPHTAEPSGSVPIPTSAGEPLVPTPLPQLTAGRMGSPTAGSAPPDSGLKGPNTAKPPGSGRAGAKSPQFQADQSTATGPTSRVSAPRRALLAIRTDPPVASASIYVDDQPQGTTQSNGSSELPGLSPGRHRLSLRLGGYRDYNETLDLIAGRNRKTLTLVPVMSSRVATATPALVSNSVESTSTLAELEIHTNPTAGVWVYVDEKMRGTTDLEGYLRISGLSPGRHRLRFDHQDCDSHEQAVNLAPGPNTESVTLLRIAGRR